MEFYSNDVRRFFGRILRKAGQRGVHVPDVEAIQTILDDLGQAEHFFLPEDFPKHHEPSSDLIQGVRLPYKKTVLEYPATIDPAKIRPGQAGAPKRIALLTEHTIRHGEKVLRDANNRPYQDEELEGFIVQPVYWLTEPVNSWEVYPASCFVPYDTEVRALGPKRGWDIAGTSIVASLPELAQMQTDEWQREGFSIDDITHTMMADLSDEIRAALVFLAMLGCKNVHAVNREPTHTERKKARKRGFLPPYSYKVLNVFLGEEAAPQGESQGGTHRSPRLHTVRGHFKTIRGNRYWWRPFMRGKAEQGVVQKDYRVKERKSG